MKTVILGSGPIGLMAKEIYPHADIIPFGRSRFYNHYGILHDDYIDKSDSVDRLFDGIPLYDQVETITNAISYKGNLIFNPDDILKTLLADKLFGDGVHIGFNQLFKNIRFVYWTKISRVYDLLRMKYDHDIIVGTKYNGVININIESKEIETDVGIVKYDNIISTIPLYALCDYTNISVYNKYADVWIYRVRGEFDTEGANMTYVADSEYDILYVSQSKRMRGDSYSVGDFFCRTEIQEPHQYFNAFMKSSVVNASMIEKAYPSCMPPNMKIFEDKNIFCVGRHAQCDYFMDVASSVKRLYGLEGRV